MRILSILVFILGCGIVALKVIFLIFPWRIILIIWWITIGNFFRKWWRIVCSAASLILLILWISWWLVPFPFYSGLLISGGLFLLFCRKIWVLWIITLHISAWLLIFFLIELIKSWRIFYLLICIILFWCFLKLIILDSFN